MRDIVIYTCVFMETKMNNYELAYLLTPQLSEEEVLMHAGKVTTLIEDIKGMIEHVEKPRLRRLGYSIKKETQAYFAWTDFTMNPESTVSLEKRLKEQQFILRHMLIHRERIDMKRSRSRLQSSRTATTQTEKVIKKEERAEEKLDLETLDKKLEEILGK